MSLNKDPSTEESPTLIQELGMQQDHITQRPCLGGACLSGDETSNRQKKPNAWKAGR